MTKASEICDIVRRIPEGGITTYGDISEQVYGHKSGGSGVGQAIKAEKQRVKNFPWWRVIGSSYCLLSRGELREEQKSLLEKEGWKINPDGRLIGGSLLPAIFNIFSQWHLTGAQQITLLGLSNERTLYNWKKQPEKAKLTRDMLERASYILGIYKSLQILLPDPVLADQWLSTPNDNPLFNGAAPLDRLLAGHLAVIRNFLDTERSGW